MIANLPWGLELEAAIEPAGLAVEMRWDGARLQTTVVNASGGTIAAEEVRLSASPDWTSVSGWAWLHGRLMQRDALVRTFAEPLPEGYEGLAWRDRGDDEGRLYISNEVLALYLPFKANSALVIGSVRPGAVFFDIEISLDDDESTLEALDLVFDLDGIVLAPGERLDLPPILISEGRDAVALMEHFADETAVEMQARVPGHVPTGWCSWYYFYGSVSEADILSNIETMRATNHPAEYVQIDDGFQSFTGDWLTPNAKFPSGMAALATRIGDAGYKPGLWLAPFLLHEDSATLRDHPEMALKTRAGVTLFVDTWLGRCAVLDCTHPQSEVWLREVVAKVTREWGYVYLKLDALAFAAQPPREVAYHRAGTTAPANLRRGLEIIREAAGDQTFILGCTCHFGPAIGLVDAMRVGPDVKETWEAGPHPSVRHAMRMTLQRNWMHGRWWVNDPDCLMVREANTQLNEAEVRFLATAIAASGGMVVASDDLPWLSPARREMALALFPPAGIAARPVEPGDGPVPMAWRADLGSGRALVALLNWNDEPRWVGHDVYLAPGEIAFDLWNQRLLGLGDILLQPHEGILWQVTGRGATPRVVGDSASLTYQGLFQRPVSGRIQVGNDLDRPRVLAIEARGQVFEVDLAGGEKRWFD